MLKSPADFVLVVVELLWRGSFTDSSSENIQVQVDTCVVCCLQAAIYVHQFDDS